eukprot:COSAG01_NODE_4415_length_5047_cov_12.598222_2_plen_486_part_00
MPGEISERESPKEKFKRRRALAKAKAEAQAAAKVTEAERVAAQKKATARAEAETKRAAAELRAKKKAEAEAARLAEEKRRVEEEKAAAEAEAARLAEEKRVAEEKAAAEAEAARLAEEKRVAEEKAAAEVEAARLAEEKRVAEEQRLIAEQAAEEVAARAAHAEAHLAELGTTAANDLRAPANFAPVFVDQGEAAAQSTEESDDEAEEGAGVGFDEPANTSAEARVTAQVALKLKPESEVQEAQSRPNGMEPQPQCDNRQPPREQGMASLLVDAQVRAERRQSARARKMFAKRRPADAQAAASLSSPPSSIAKCGSPPSVQGSPSPRSTSAKPKPRSAGAAGRKKGPSQPSPPGGDAGRKGGASSPTKKTQKKKPGISDADALAALSSSPGFIALTPVQQVRRGFADTARSQSSHALRSVLIMNNPAISARTLSCILAPPCAGAGQAGVSCSAARGGHDVGGGGSRPSSTEENEFGRGGRVRSVA